MTAADLTSLWPLIIPPVGAVVVMLVLAFYRNHALTAVLTLVSLGASIMMIPVSISAGARSVGSLLIMDGYAFFFIGLIFSAAFIVALLSYSYLEKRKGYREEFYILLLLAATGSAVLPASNHFAAFFLGLEILSLSLYVLIAYSREGANGLEAGVKYLILAAVSTAFLLFGMALIYADLGSLGFSQNEFYQTLENRQRLLPLVGLGMILVGVAFKLAVVPFHLWTPDVYQGAPAPVAAFVATVSKGAVFAFLFRYFALNSAHAGVLPNEAIRWTLALIAILSMFAGNLLALLQNNVKRILAYSSIAHLGYLLVALLAATAAGLPRDAFGSARRLAEIALIYYLAAYFVTTLGAWGTVAILSTRAGDPEALEDYRGLAWRNPWVAAFFTAILLSLAGIPLTAGFIGKFYLLAAGVSTSLWLLVIILVANSAIGLFYYLRIVVALYTRSSEQKVPEGDEAGSAALSFTSGLAFFILAVFLFWLGVYPSSFLSLLDIILL